MNTVVNTTTLNLNITSFMDSREVVNKLNTFYAGTGVIISQKAKYERPTWFYILAVLTHHRQSINQIVEKLKQHNLNVTRENVYRFLKIMLNTRRAIHPHRRNCGMSCHTMVIMFGGVHCDVASIPTRACPADGYYLGEHKHNINYLKRVYGISINPA